MGLPKLFSKKETAKNDLFILSLITDQSIHSSLWQVYEQKIILLSKSKVRYYQGAEEQLLQMDESLQDLGQRSEETDEILFAFEPGWIEKNKISAEHEKELKKITESLSLKPLGFVSVTESILQHLLKINNFLSSIVLHIGSDFLDLTIIRQGKAVGSLSVGRSEDIALDLQEALARLEKDFAANGAKLPPNIVLSSAVIDQEKLNLFQQQLIELNWTEDFNFVQQPVIEIIDPEKLLDIVTKYYGEALARQKGLIDAPQKNDDQKAFASQSLTGLNFADSDQESKKTNTSQPSTAQAQTETSPNSDQSEVNKTDSMQTSFGVPIGQAALIKQKNLQQKSTQPSVNSSSSELSQQLSQPVFAENEISDQDKPAVAVNIKPGQEKKTKNKTSLKLIIIAAAILGLLVSGVVSYFLLRLNYRVEILLSPKIENLSTSVVMGLDATIPRSNLETKLLKATLIEEVVSDKDTIQTTGVKPIGEKAKGEVTIFNKTGEEKTFAKGTIFRYEDLEFELDEEVTVPAAKTEETEDGEAEIRAFGQKKTILIAKEIGAESNIDRRLDLKVADFSDNTYSARTEEDFTGGLSREIRVVAEADHEELMTNLRQRLLKQARDKLESRSGQDIYVVPTEDYKIVEQKFSDEVAEETDSVSLELTISVQGLSYTAEDLSVLSRNVLENEISKDFELLDESLDFMSRIVSDDEDEQIQIEIDITGKSQAKVELQDIQEQLVGISIEQARNLLTEADTIAEIESVYTPFFAGSIFTSLPDEADRIMIKAE